MNNELAMVPIMYENPQKLTNEKRELFVLWHDTIKLKVSRSEHELLFLLIKK